MKNIAIAGQFDAFVPDLVRWLSKKYPNQLLFTALNGEALDLLAPVSWRLGSLLAPNNVETMLCGIDVLIYFNLTPPTSQKSSEGIMRDVALCAAENLARASAKNPSLRVILLSRTTSASSDDADSLGNVFVQIETIFRNNVDNLCIVQTQPVLFEADAIATAVFERAVTLDSSDKSSDLQNFDKFISAPVSREAFYRSVAEALMDVRASIDICVCGNLVMTWKDWILTSSQVVSSRHRLNGIKRVHFLLNPDVHQRACILRDYIAVSEPAFDGIKPISARDRLNLQQFSDDLADNPKPALFLKKANQKTPAACSCYVQRIISHSSRTVADASDLFMEWMPRYFKNTISVNDVSENRILCRALRIPLVELEKSDESAARCRITMRCPWLASLKDTTCFVVTKIGDILLIVIENAPKSKTIMAGLRAMLLAFGQYLKEYGA